MAGVLLRESVVDWMACSTFEEDQNPADSGVGGCCTTAPCTSDSMLATGIDFVADDSLLPSGDTARSTIPSSPGTTSASLSARRKPPGGEPGSEDDDDTLRSCSYSYNKHSVPIFPNADCERRAL